MTRVRQIVEEESARDWLRRHAKKTVFKFSELSDEAKEVARNCYRDASYDEWWDSVYEDAAQAGLRITGFDLQHGRSASGRFIEDAETAAQKIIADHGDQCDTYKTASAYLADRKKLQKLLRRDPDELESQLDELEAEFLRDLLHDYANSLQREWDYRNSDENVDENIEYNEYTFTEEGERT